MISRNRQAALQSLDALSKDVPFTHTRICHLLFDLVTTFTAPKVVEVSCGYGKATLYLASGAKARGGLVRCVDIARPTWRGRTTVDLLREAGLLNVCNVTFGEDARWYLLDLFRQRPDSWIDVAYVDASHTVEVDAFIALALWTHLRPGGLLVFDDLDWVPAVHGPRYKTCSRPSISHVRALFEYVSRLPMVDEKAEWGRDELQWTWGLIRKQGPGSMSGRGIRDLLTSIGIAEVEAK